MKVLIITNGDSAAALLRAAGYEADILPWRDVLHEGPVPLTSEGHFSDLESLSVCRAEFLAEAFSAPKEKVLQRFVERDRMLRRHVAYDEITLWFEHDLYDQLQLLQILSFFNQDGQRRPLQLVQANDYLGRETKESIRRFEAAKTEVSNEQLVLAGQLFQAFRRATPELLASYIKEDLGALPFIKQALNRLFEELPAIEDGLSRSQRQALRLIQRNQISPKRLFGEAQTYEEAVFMGDLSFWQSLEELAFNRRPLVQGLPMRFAGAQEKDQQQHYMDAELTLTDIGESVLAGNADHAELNAIDRWLGGTHIVSRNIWRWDAKVQMLLPPG